MEAVSSNILSNTIYKYLNVPISTTGWVFWLLVLIFIFFLLWLFFGRGDYEYIGLSPLNIGVDSTKYINGHTYAAIEKSNRGAKKITGDDVSIVSNSDDTYTDNTDTDNTDTSDTNPITPTDNNFTPSNTSAAIPNNSTPIGLGRRVSKGERRCKEVLEEIYNKPFLCVRPNFLKNPETKRNLELDCYNEDLKLAVEYNGVQHYKWPNFTGQTKEAFIKQIRRDKYKIEVCDSLGIYLITVPYNVPHGRIKDYIMYYLPENYNQRMKDEQDDRCFISENDSESYDIISQSYDDSDDGDLNISFVNYE